MCVLPVQSNYIISNILKCFLWLPNITTGYFTNHHFPFALWLNLHRKTYLWVQCTQLRNTQRCSQSGAVSWFQMGEHSSGWNTWERKVCCAGSASYPDPAPWHWINQLLQNLERKISMLKAGYSNSMDPVTFPRLPARCTVICSVGSFPSSDMGLGIQKAHCAWDWDKARIQRRWDKHLCHLFLYLLTWQLSNSASGWSWSVWQAMNFGVLIPDPHMICSTSSISIWDGKR